MGRTHKLIIKIEILVKMALFDFLNKPKSVLEDIAGRSGLGFLLEKLKPTFQRQYSPQNIAGSIFPPYGFWQKTAPMREPGFPTRLKEGIEQIPSPKFSPFGVGIPSPVDIGKPLLKGLVDVGFGTEEERTAKKREEEIWGKMRFAPKEGSTPWQRFKGEGIEVAGVTPEEQRFAWEQMQQSATIQGMYAATMDIVPGMTEAKARAILKVGKNATPEEINAAYRNIVNKPGYYPRTAKEMASKTKNTAGKIIVDARNFLLEKAQAAQKPLFLPAGQQPVTQPQPKAGGEVLPFKVGEKAVRETGEKALKERGFVKTVKEAVTTAPEVAEKVEGVYKPITNKETIRKAKNVIDMEGWDVAKNRVFKEPLSAETNTIGQLLMERAQKEKRFDEAVEIAETLARKGTEAGQAIQSFSVWSKLTPEGMLKYATKQIMTAEEKMGFATRTMRKIFGKEMPKLMSDDAEYITDIMKQANKATSETEKARLSKLALERVADKIPWGVSDVIDTYRYNNMLSNPMTHLRNAWSNLINTFVAKPGAMVAEGRPIEAVKYETGALKAFPDAIDSFVKTFKGEEVIDLTKKIDIQTARGKKVPLAVSWPTRGMEAGDKFFSALIEAGEKARGATAGEARKAAEYWLYRQNLSPAEQGYLLNALDNIPKGLYYLRKVPFAGWTIPFIRTPFNFGKMWFEFSPMGFATIPGASNKRAQMGKALIGSIVTLVGLKAALEGRTTWSSPTTEKEKELFYATGRKPFSVLIQGKWVPMATFGPFAWAVALPAAWQYFDKEARTALTDEDYGKAAKTVGSLVNFWSQSTPMQGLGGFVRMIEGDVDYNLIRTAASTTSQLVPFTALQRYIATAIDPIYRRPRTFGEQLKTGIPFLSKQIERTYTEPTGEPSERNIWQYFTPYGLGEGKSWYEPLLKEYQRERQEKYLQKKEKEEGGWTSTAPVFKPKKRTGSPTREKRPFIMR